MRHTKNETHTTTLTRLITALDKRQPVTIRAADRDTGEMRSFRTDRIVSYTVHRTAYTVALPAADEPKQRTTSGLATVTVLYPVDCPATACVQLLADALAA